MADAHSNQPAAETNSAAPRPAPATGSLQIPNLAELGSSRLTFAPDMTEEWRAVREKVDLGEEFETDPPPVACPARSADEAARLARYEAGCWALIGSVRDFAGLGNRGRQQLDGVCRSI